MAKENKLEWATNLRVIATFSVILIHVASSAVSNYGKVSMPLWWMANFTDASLRFCVPIFVMLSGALLLGKEYSLQDFLSKRLIRIVWPFLFWSMLYILWAFSFTKIQHLNFSTISISVFESLRKGASYHMWYVYMIIGLYLFIPIIGKWVRNASEKELLYFLLLWFCTLCFNYSFLSKYSINLDVRYFTGYLGYLVLGYYLSVKTFSFPVQKIALGLLLVGIAITAGGTYCLSHQAGKYTGDFYAYLSPNVFFLSMGLFLFVKALTFSNTTVLKIRDFISRYSYGIYLSHVLVLSALSRWAHIHWMYINPYVGIPVTVVLCFVLSLSLVYLVHKLPYGKYISG